jgi:hypothetical protein
MEHLSHSALPLATRHTTTESRGPIVSFLAKEWKTLESTPFEEVVNTPTRHRIHGVAYPLCIGNHRGNLYAPENGDTWNGWKKPAA